MASFPDLDPEMTRDQLGELDDDDELDDDVAAAWERLANLDNASPETVRYAERFRKGL